MLETAAGTGIATRALVRALPSGVRIVATDLNRPMLGFAASRTDAANVTWRQADALTLPVRRRYIRRRSVPVRRHVLPRQGGRLSRGLSRAPTRGRFLLNVWDRIEHNELAYLVTEAVASLFPEDPPLFLARTPHGYHDADTILDELRAAGFVGVAIETVERHSRAASPRHPAVGFCQGTPLRIEIEARDPGRLGEATDAAARAVAARFGDGPLEARIQAHVIVATR